MKYLQLDELAELINGSTPLKSNNKYWNKGSINWFTAEDLRNAYEVSSTKKFITKFALDNTSIKLVPKDSVLLCCTASIGLIGINKIELTTNQQFNAIVPNKELINFRYLFYFLKSYMSEFEKKASTTTVGFISQKKVKSILVPVPSLQEQEQIVERLEKVFENVDKKIELNLSNKLEALKESILEEEFFNKEKFQKLENCIELIMGQAPPKSETNFSGKGTLFVKTGEFGDKRPVSEEYTTKPLRLAKSTDVLISVVGATCGKINYGIDCAIGRSVAAIRPLSNLNQDYLYYLMKSYTKKLRKGSTGAAQTVINKNMINNVLIPDISKNEQDETVIQIKGIFSKLENLNQRQEKVNEKLILLKKSILNKEFSYE